MIKTLQIIFFLLIVSEVLSQEKTVLTPLDRIVANGDAYFQRGDYRHALNSYDFALKGLMYVDNESKLSEKFKKTNKILQIYNSGFSAFHNENYDEAIALFEKVLVENPNDKQAKDLIRLTKSIAGIPIPPPTNPKTPDERWLAIAQNKYKNGDKDGANNILLMLPQDDPNVKKLIAIIDGDKKKDAIIPPKPKPADIIINPCDTKKYAKLKRNLEVEYKNCRLENAKKIATEILAMDCYKSDRYALGRKGTIKTIQNQLQNIASWRSGADPSHRDFVIPEYQKVFVQNRNCVEWDYFYYVYAIAERIRQNYPCNKDAILWYRKAAGISPTLATKENIAQKIADIENCTKCNDKDALFKAIATEAEAYYNDCQYTKADSIYREALKYKCSDQSTIISHWENDIFPNISKNRNNALLFTKYKSTADSLAALSECTEAMKYYKAADSLNIDCGKLNKSDLAIKIAKMECCDVRYRFGKIKDSLNRAIKDPNTLTNVNDKTRAICHLLEVLRDMAVGGDCIDANDIFEIESGSCKICCPYFPDRECCKEPPPPLPELDTTKYTVWEASVNAYGINTQLASTIRDFDNKLSLGGASAGLQFVYGTKLGEFKAGLMYAYDNFEVKSTTVAQNKSNTDQVQIGFIRLPINIVVPLGGQKHRENQIYPFAELGIIVQTPIQYKHFQTLNQVTTNDSKLLYGLSLSSHLALGLQVKRLSISAFYNSSGSLFSSSASAPPLNLTNSAYTTLGFNLGYRFAPKRGVR